MGDDRFSSPPEPPDGGASERPTEAGEGALTDHRAPAEQRAGGRESFRTGMGFNAASFVFVAVLGAVSGIVTARQYGIRTVGEFALVTAPVEAMWFLSSVKEQAALVRELTTLPPRAPRVTGLFAAVLIFSTALTLVVGILATGATILLFRGPIHHPELVTPAVVSLVAYLLTTNVSFNIDGVFQAFVAGRALFWVRLNQNVSLLVLAVAFSFVFHSVWGIIAATYLAMVLSLVHRVLAVRRFMRLRVPYAVVREGFKTLPALLRFGARIAPGTILTGTTTQSATWILGATASIGTVGAFNRAQQLSRRFEAFNVLIAQMLFPTLVARWEAKDHKGFDRALVDTVRYCTVLTLLTGAVGAGASTAIMHLFGSGFAQAATAFSILMLMPCLSTLAVLQAHAMYALDRGGLTSFTALARMLVTIPATVVLTSTIGIEGAAIALVAGALTDITWKTLIIRSHLSQPIWVLWSPRQMVALASACLAGWGASRALQDVMHSLALLPLILVLGSIAYGGTFVLVGGFNDRDRERARSTLSGLRGRLRRQPAVVAPVAPAD